MFTGIVEETGKVLRINRAYKSASVLIECKKIIEESKTGDSVSVNGLCLTVKNIRKKSMEFTLSSETIIRSTFSKWKSGDTVNLERALKLSDRLGGHIVQGHVDCTTNITGMKKEGDFRVFNFALPKTISKYIADKGSIAIDGISLTIAGSSEKNFKIAVIPETYKNTNMQYYKINSTVNIEVDILAKYIENILKSKLQSETGITIDKIREAGFLD